MRPQRSGSVHLVRMVKVIIMVSSVYYAGQLVIIALFLRGHVKKMAQRLSCLQLSTGTSEDPKVFIVFSSGWMMSAKLLAWKYIVLNLATCKLVAMVTRGPWGMKNIKGGLETQASPSPPASPWAGDRLWQTLISPGNPTPEYSRNTGLTKHPIAFRVQ